MSKNAGDNLCSQLHFFIKCKITWSKIFSCMHYMYIIGWHRDTEKKIQIPIAFTSTSLIYYQNILMHVVSIGGIENWEYRKEKTNTNSFYFNLINYYVKVPPTSFVTPFCSVNTTMQVEEKQGWENEMCRKITVRRSFFSHLSEGQLIESKKEKY